MKNNISNQPIAILGGMGPQASARLLEVIIDMSSNEFGAEDDTDFPEIILNSIPVPNFVTNDENLNEALRILKMRVKNLESLEPTCFAIACNTAHLLLGILQSNTSVPFISMIEEVVDRITETQVNKIGLLATPTTIRSGLYQSALKQRKIDFIVPSQKEIRIVENVIKNILRGKILNSDREKLVRIADSLRKNGAQGIILGCTELPLIFPKKFNIPVFDSIEILARALTKKAYESSNKNAIINL